MIRNLPALVARGVEISILSLEMLQFVSISTPRFDAIKVGHVAAPLAPKISRHSLGEGKSMLAAYGEVRVKPSANI
jgi:hypothetical protein